VNNFWIKLINCKMDIWNILGWKVAAWIGVLIQTKCYITSISKTASEVNLLTLWKNDMLVQSRCLSDTFTINYSMTSSGVLWINSLAHDISGYCVTSFQINECVDGAGRERNPSGNKSFRLPLVHMSFGEGRKYSYNWIILYCTSITTA